MTNDIRFSRRHALGLGAFAVVGAACGLPLARALRQRRLVRRTLPVMGTLAEVAVVTGADLDEAAAHDAIDAAFDRLLFVDKTMSRYRSDSDVGRLNAAAGAAVAVRPETRHVLARALEFAERSAGAFDPLLGRVTEAWEVTERDAPPRGPIEPGQEPWRQLALSSAGATIGDAHLDLGGIAKGFGVDEAVRVLREAGATQAFVNAGGDLYALGHSEDGDPWRVGVRDPKDATGTRFLRTLDLADAAVATSGTYERYFEHGGRRYHHLMDGHAGAPFVTALHSRTVRAASCMDADAGATASFGVAAAGRVARDTSLHELVEVLA